MGAGKACIDSDSDSLKRTFRFSVPWQVCADFGRRVAAYFASLQELAGAERTFQLSGATPDRSFVAFFACFHTGVQSGSYDGVAHQVMGTGVGLSDNRLLASNMD